jgi:hypothetical protein
MKISHYIIAMVFLVSFSLYAISVARLINILDDLKVTLAGCVNETTISPSR